MCGIAGEVNFKQHVSSHNLRLMTNALRHRGPDDEGSYINEDYSVSLGHRRLSFLDLGESGRQPICNEKKDVWITFNGEIYNYLELRDELISLGHTFHTATDTEVIVHGYEEWGTEVVSRLKGMFAFGIWDQRKKCLFLVRDRFGIKPLYYYYQNGTFLFASEIKGVKAHPNANTSLNLTSFTDYFVYRYVPSPNTIWNEVSKLPPAHWLMLYNDGSTETCEYWKLPTSNTKMSDAEALSKFDELLLNSVKIHARSDVPVGSFLSGGYDSSAIVYYMSRFGYVPHTFSIGFSGWDVSEHLYAEEVAKLYHTQHHSTILNEQSLDILHELVWVYDEPIADISIIPTYLVSQQAAKQVKCVMSGEGADEFLVGYQWQKEYKTEQVNLLDKLLRFFNHQQSRYLLNYYGERMSMGRFERNELLAMLTPHMHQHVRHQPEWFYESLYKESIPELKAIQTMDIKHFMGELVLCKMDRASMANSLEVRVPFLDHELCEFVFGLDTSVYYRPSETKHMLYQNLKSHLPDSILNRKKQGFVGPDIYYMNFDWYQNLLKDSKLVTDGLVMGDYIKGLFENKDYWRLWKVSVMELWYRRWC